MPAQDHPEASVDDIVAGLMDLSAEARDSWLRRAEKDAPELHAQVARLLQRVQAGLAEVVNHRKDIA